MHNEVREYINKVKAMFPKHFENGFVLDVGSLDINGNNREFFNSSNYTGIDIVRGPNVEYVCSIVDWETPIKYNVVISTEMLEHNKDWKESLFKMYKLLRKFGLLVVTCAGINRREHGTTKNSPKDSPGTNDYYRNISKDDILSVLPNAIVSEWRGQQDIGFYLLKQ